MTDIGRRIESAKRSAVIYRNYRRARERALTRLSNAYPETYKELLEQEKIVDEQLGKKWIDIDGSTGAIDSVHTDTTSTYTRGGEGEQASASPDQGNNGGKA
jgi:hypothetical protein